MTKPVPLIIGIIGIVFFCIIGIVLIGVALVYWLTPAGGLPSFLPGFEAASDHFHLTHALGLLIVARNYGTALQRLDAGRRWWFSRCS